eukprot:6934397-Pyramimonas_sp.AAC.1
MQLLRERARGRPAQAVRLALGDHLDDGAGRLHLVKVLAEGRHCHRVVPHRLGTARGGSGGDLSIKFRRP